MNPFCIWFDIFSVHVCVCFFNFVQDIVNGEIQYNHWGKSEQCTSVTALRKTLFVDMTL